MPSLLRGGGWADRPHVEAARIELLSQAADRTALARRIPAFEHEHRPALLVIVRLLDRQHLELELLQPLLVVVAIRARLRSFEFLEVDFRHDQPLRWQAERRP